MEFSVSSYYDHLSHMMGELDHASVDAAISLIKKSWADKKKIIVCGNGGSALTGDYLRVRAEPTPTTSGLRVLSGTLRGEPDHLYIAWPHAKA